MRQLSLPKYNMFAFYQWYMYVGKSFIYYLPEIDGRFRESHVYVLMYHNKYRIPNYYGFYLYLVFVGRFQFKQQHFLVKHRHQTPTDRRNNPNPISWASSSLSVFVLHKIHERFWCTVMIDNGSSYSLIQEMNRSEVVAKAYDVVNDIILSNSTFDGRTTKLETICTIWLINLSFSSYGEVLFSLSLILYALS